MRGFSPIIVIVFLTGLAWPGNVTIEGGNITHVELGYQLANATWHAVHGLVRSPPFALLFVNATPGNITYIEVNTGSSQCSAGTSNIILMFSNSSAPITSLVAGNLTLLDEFVGTSLQNGSHTFALTSSFTTDAFGTILNVPTTYIEPVSSQAFRLGYMNDQLRNLVFVAPYAAGANGFSGNATDFEAILPCKNGSDVGYYVHLNQTCSQQPPVPPGPPGEGGGGGGGGETKMTYSQTPSDCPSYTQYVDAGNGNFCSVRLRKTVMTSENQTVLTTVVTNRGGANCGMEDFVFTDLVPQKLGPIEKISFSPDYNSLQNYTVRYIFPIFLPGESRTLSYSVNSKVYIRLTCEANFSLSLVRVPVQPPATGPEINVTLPPKQVCTREVRCGQWGPCAEGYHTRECKVISNCDIPDFFRVERCIGLPSIPSAEQIAASPFACFTSIYACAAVAVVFAATLAGTYLAERDRKKKEEELEAKGTEKGWAYGEGGWCPLPKRKKQKETEER